MVGADGQLRGMTVGDTGRAMSKESTTPDLVELGHRLFEAANRRDFDAMLSFFAPEVVWEARAFGITFEGVAAIRGFWQDWWASYEELWAEQEEALDWRHAADALGRSDFDAGLSCFAPDAVWEVQPLASSFEGVPAIRSFVEDWIGNYDEYHQELVEGQDLGNDVVFALNRQDARLAGTTSRVQELWSFTITWRAGMIDRVIGRNDFDEARAAAERLAEERE